MDKKKLSELIKVIAISLGTLVVVLAATNVPRQLVGLWFLLLVAFSVLVIPRTNMALSHARMTFSFADSIIFLTFLLCGGELAILIAFIESLANCYHLRKAGNISGKWIVLYNSSIAAIVTAISYGVLLFYAHNVDPSVLNVTNTRSLVTALGIISLSQFFGSSIFAAFFQKIKTGNAFWDIWKKQCLFSSLTQFTAVCLSGIVYKLTNYSDPVVILISGVGLVVVYYSYRQNINEINLAMRQAEEAERQKAEAERSRRKEAEKNAAQLEVLLEKEEQINEALRKSETTLIHSALHDSLTKLPNRKQFGDLLLKCIDKYKENASNTFHVLFLDIRKFKNINDSLGHTVGDKVLMIAAKRFKKMLKNTDMVARIGGDEFAVILNGLSTTGKAQKVARRIYDSISQPFSLGGNSITIEINIGVAPCDEEYNKPEEILRDADIAMHYAKEKNSGVAVFTKELRVRFLERVRFENDLRHAIDRNELTMNYQPLVVLRDGSLLGFEALLRWHHSELGLIPPNKFIPIAEESGLIIPITKWILEETSKQIAIWQKISSATKNLIVSVNVSGKHLSKDELVDDVENALHISKISPTSLKLEITESAAMENAEHTISVLNRLKNLGVQLSIDDFGTGYSSFSYLHRLPFDTLKIDRSFVYNVGEKGENSEILQSIISLAKNLRKKVIAEGIETESQLALLQNLGCDYGQGYVMARPMTKDKIEKALYEGRNWLPAKRVEKEWPNTVVTEEENLPVF